MTSAARKCLVAGGLCVAWVMPACAEEWSLEPSLEWSGDHRSNRLLREGTPSGESVAASFDMNIARRTETSEFLVRPHLRVQRFSDDVAPNVDEQRLSVASRWNFERSQLRISAEAAEESTLTTELAETGLISADAARRTVGGELEWSITHAPSRQFLVNLSHSDVGYTGAYDGRLFGYQYSALSAGESLRFAERFALSFTGSATLLRSPDRDSESREHAVQVGIDFDWTERTALSASFGASRRNIDGEQSSGTTGYLTLTHEDGARDWRFSVAHSLVPYGTGVLTEHDDATFSFTQRYSSRVQARLNLGVARNRDTVSTFDLDNRTYRHGDLELGWMLRETWRVAVVAGVASASEPQAFEGNISGWSFELRGAWTPNPHVFGH
jgi:hypothetical protein